MMAGDVNCQVPAGIDSTTGAASPIKTTLQALWVYLASKIAGERLENSATNGYMDVRSEGVGRVLTVAGPTGLAGSGASTLARDAHLVRIHINAALTGTLVVNGLFNDQGVAAPYTVPNVVGPHEFGHLLNEAGALTFTLSNAVADTGKVLVVTRGNV